MTTDPTGRVDEIGAGLAERMPGALDAPLVLSESVPPALDTARSERYEIQHPIGTGGQAEVLLGIVRGADGFHRPVAIKRPRSDLAEQGRVAANLLEEAHLASGLSHPNVVSVLDFDHDPEGRPYLVMEYVDGVDLGTLTKTGPLPHPVAIFIVRELLSGLGYIHEHRGRGRVRGLVHRDVTPHNVLVSWEGAIKLADFGVAQVLEDAVTAGSEVPVGKAGYMSPEQADCRELDGRSDLYAVGIVLWELLACRRLRVGAEGDLRAHAVFQAIPRPSECRQGVPADLEAVAMKLLAYDPEERYRTAELAAHDLLRCQDVPRDGRGELVRVLDERFPRLRRRRPAHSQAPSNASRTVTVASALIAAPSAPWPRGQGRAAVSELWRQWRALAFGVLVAVVSASTFELLVVSG